MSFDYVANINAVKQVLTDHNTTTASPDLSTGLTTRVKAVSVFDPESQNIRSSDVPAVYVRLSTKTEEYASLGNTGPAGNKKQAVVMYDVFGMYQREGIYSQEQDVLNEIYKLASNIEGVIQSEMTLSNTALWCNIEETDFSPVAVADDGIFIKSVKVNISAKYLFR